MYETIKADIVVRHTPKFVSELLL